MSEENKDGFETISIGLSETWEPEEGSIVQGKLVEIKTGIGDFGSVIYVLEKDNKELISVWSSTVLKTKMQTINLLDTVRIKYLGEKKSPKSGRQYKDFEVAVKRT